MPPRRTNARNVNVRNANATPPVPNQEVSNAEFRNVIHMIAQSMTHQNNHVHNHENENGGSVASMLCDFVMMSLLEFLESQINEDSLNFMDEIKKIIELMQVIGNDRVYLVSYHLNDVAHIWYYQLKENRGTYAAPITWYCFSETFLDMFFPIELREAKAEEFMNIRQGNMKVQEYGLKFNHVSRYAPHMVADSKAQMNTFLYKVSSLVKSEYRNAMLLGDMNIYRIMTNAQ